MNRIFGILGFAIIAAATYLTFSHSWPSAPINEWQVKMMGDNKYYPALTIFLTALPLLFILLLIKLVVLRLSKKQQ